MPSKTQLKKQRASDARKEITTFLDEAAGEEAVLG
jgi:hypothetical protein